jgi:hypothetical protein
MTVALATRGYLYPRFLGQFISGEGPVITSVQESAPEVTGAARVAADAPSVSGIIAPAPEISSSAGAAEQPGEAPIISGSEKPKIN